MLPAADLGDSINHARQPLGTLRGLVPRASDRRLELGPGGACSSLSRRGKIIAAGTREIDSEDIANLHNIATYSPEFAIEDARRLAWIDSGQRGYLVVRKRKSLPSSPNAAS